MIPSYEEKRRGAVTAVTVWIWQIGRLVSKICGTVFVLVCLWSRLAMCDGRREIMTHYVIIALVASAPVTYLYSDAKRALAKVRTLQRLGNAFKIKDTRTELELAPADLEQATLAR